MAQLQGRDPKIEVCFKHNLPKLDLVKQTQVPNK